MSDLRDLRRHLDRRAERTADIHRMRMKQPLGGGGLHLIQHPASGQSLIARGPAGITWKPGAMVPVGSHLGGPGRVILVGPPPGQQGASNFPAPSYGPPATTAALAVLSVSPATYAQGGSALAITLTGVGFAAGDTFEVVRPSTSDSTGWALDERFTLTITSVDSDTQATGTLDVAASAPVGQRFSVRVARGNRRHVGVDLAEVEAAPVVVLESLHGVTLNGSTYEVWQYFADGSRGDMLYSKAMTYTGSDWPRRIVPIGSAGLLMLAYPAAEYWRFGPDDLLDLTDGAPPANFQGAPVGGIQYESGSVGCVVRSAFDDMIFGWSPTIHLMVLDIASGTWSEDSSDDITADTFAPGPGEHVEGAFMAGSIIVGVYEDQGGNRVIPRFTPGAGALSRANANYSGEFDQHCRQQDAPIWDDAATPHLYLSPGTENGDLVDLISSGEGADAGWRALDVKSYVASADAQVATDQEFRWILGPVRDSGGADVPNFVIFEAEDIVTPPVLIPMETLPSGGWPDLIYDPAYVPTGVPLV